MNLALSSNTHMLILEEEAGAGDGKGEYIFPEIVRELFAM